MCGQHLTEVSLKAAVHQAVMARPLRSSTSSRARCQRTSSHAALRPPISKALLFGEIASVPTSSAELGCRLPHSTQVHVCESRVDGELASARPTIKECSVILCASHTFATLWYESRIRDYLIELLDSKTLGAMRLVCHDFKTRCAPALYKKIRVESTARFFTRESRMRGLERIGYLAETLTFDTAFTQAGSLPPLIDPITGGERTFTYTPQAEVTPKSLAALAEVPDVRHRFWDDQIHELLIRQYPPEFHAATNVDSFLRALRAMPNIRRLIIYGPSSSPMQTGSRRTVTDYALLSLRMAVERSNLTRLESLSLRNMGWQALQHLHPALALGSSSRTARKWDCITNLEIEMIAPGSNSADLSEHIATLRSYIGCFSRCLHRLTFRWLQGKGPRPFFPASKDVEQADEAWRTEKALGPAARQRAIGLHFPLLKCVVLGNAAVDASQIASFIRNNLDTGIEMVMEDIDLRTGDWQEALQPLERVTEKAEQCRYGEALAQSRDCPARPEYTPSPRSEVQSTTSMDVPLCMEPDKEDAMTIMRLQQRTPMIDHHSARTWGGVKTDPGVSIPLQSLAVTVCHGYRSPDEVHGIKRLMRWWPLALRRSSRKIVHSVTVADHIEHETGVRKLHVLTDSLLRERQANIRHNIEGYLAQYNEGARARRR